MSVTTATGAPCRPRARRRTRYQELGEIRVGVDEHELRAGDLLDRQGFEALQISAEETLELRPGSRLQIVGEYDLSPGLVHSTTYEVHSADGEYRIVETVTNADPLSAIGDDIERLETVSVNGVTGWHTSRTDVDGEWNGIVWSPSPNQAAFVSGDEPLATVLEVAESLVIVDAETWVDETGCANCAEAEPDPDPPGAR